MNDSRGYWGRYWDRQVSRRRILRGGAVGAAGAMAAFYAACSGNSGNKAANNSSNAATRPATTAAAAARTSTASGGVAVLQGTTAAGGAQAVPAAANTAIPLLAGVPGGKINLAQTLEPTTLDPLNAISGGDPPYYMNVYDYFVYIHHYVPDPTLSLADKWEIVDPTHINFHLRQGVTFHDGSPWDAATYQWNMKRILDPANKAVALGALSSVDHVDTPDPQTVGLVLKEPNAAIFYSLALPTASPVSRQAVEKFGDQFKSNPVGTGPFAFQEWVTGSHVTVKKNPNYWMKDVAGKPLPYLDQVTLTTIPDANTQFANLQAGSIDFCGLGSLNLLTPAQADKNITVIQGVPGSSVASVLAFNPDKAPLNNVNLRKAIAFACDADAVNRTVYFGKYQVGKDAMITPGSWAYQDTPGRPTYDLAQAKQFLAAGGQPNGFNVDMVVYNSPTINQQAELYQANLKQIGIIANIVIQDVGPATDNFFVKGQFPLYSTAWSGTDFEPNIQASRIYAKDGVYNSLHHEVAPGLEDLIARARQTFDLNQRKDLYAQISKVITADQCFFIPMVLATPYTAWRNNIGGTAAAPDLDIFRMQFYWNKGS